MPISLGFLEVVWVRRTRDISSESFGSDQGGGGFNGDVLLGNLDKKNSSQ